MRKAVLVDGRRTPFFKAGTVKNLFASELAQTPVSWLFEQYPNLKRKVDCVIGANVGNQLLPPDGSNLARIILLKAGIDNTVPAWTVNINCASGLHAALDAVKNVELGLYKCVLVIAVEAMSDYTATYGREQRDQWAKLVAIAKDKKSSVVAKLSKAFAQKTKIRTMAHDPQWLIRLGLTDPVCGLGMDKVSDKLAAKFGLSRETLDMYAQESHRRAFEAQQAGVFNDEVIPFNGITADNGVHAGQLLKDLARIRPLNKDGVTTAGNSSQVTDGAVALLICDKEFAEAEGLPKLAGLSSEWSATAGCEPSLMGLGPVTAIKVLLDKMAIGGFQYELADFGVVETNEAFASVVLSQAEALASKQYCAENFNMMMPVGRLDMDKTNVNGGAIAIGHPIAASGARLMLTCAKEMHRKNQQYGLVTLCVGGGQGEAMVLERS